MREILWVPAIAAVFLMVYGVLRCRSWRTALVLSLSVGVSVVFSLFYLIADIFTGEGLTSAVVFHVLNGFHNENDIGMGEFPELVALVLAAGAIFIVWMWLLNRRVGQRTAAATRTVAIEAIFIAFAVILAVPLHPVIAESGELWRELVPKNYEVLNRELKPIPAALVPERPRSLVYIYAESYERAFLNDAIFPDLAPNLKELERQALSIYGIGQAPLTDWTIAGMVASQCGMPLATISTEMNDPGLGRAKFLPGTSCIGDILESQGYQLAYLGGADTRFAGKGNFYRTHGFDEVVGSEELGGIIDPEFSRSKWGAYDQDVFKAGLIKFRELNSADRPFALILLTTGTHPPSGFVSPQCGGIRYRDGKHGMLNAAKCSDKEISDFVRSIESEARDDVLVVVASDHLQRATGASALFDEKGLVRENMFFVRGLGRTGVVRRDATTMDLAPTLLSLLGTPMEHLALGRNLLVEGETMSEKYGREEFYSMVSSWRAGLWKAWVPDETDD